MLDLTYQRVRVLEPTWFYPTMDRYWCLHGNAVRGYPPMGGTVLKCSPRNVLVRAEPALCGESGRRFAWIPRNNVAVIVSNPKEI
jgi:hypothetical protein